MGCQGRCSVVSADENKILIITIQAIPNVRLVPRPGSLESIISALSLYYISASQNINQATYVYIYIYCVTKIFISHIMTPHIHDMNIYHDIALSIYVAVQSY